MGSITIRSRLDSDDGVSLSESPLLLDVTGEAQDPPESARCAQGNLKTIQTNLRAEAGKWIVSGDARRTRLRDVGAGHG